MSATYSSFDTLTIGQYEGGSAPSGPLLPVLAEIPAIAAKPAAPDLDPPRAPLAEFRAEPAHAAQIAPPKFQAAPPPAAAPPTEQHPVAAEVAPTTAVSQPAPAPRVEEASDESDWEDSTWAAQLLSLEASLRPHARLILLAALIAITGLMLVVLRSPVEIPTETLPSNMVDSSATPALTDSEGATMVATGYATPSGLTERALDPIPSMQAVSAAAPAPPSATVTAVGPASMPAAASPAPATADITPIPPHRTASAEVAAAPAPQGESPVRVAERPSYPTTNFSTQSWPAPTTVAPPHAQLQQPTKPPTAGMQ